MTTCLKIGRRLLDGEQLISSLIPYKMLETLVGQVILDEVIQEVSLSQDEVYRSLTGDADDAPLEDFETFVDQWCEQRQTNWEYFKAVVVRELRIEKFKQTNFSKQIESEFFRSKADLDQVEYSLIQVSQLPLAEELYFQLRDDGVEFAQLAQQHSLGSERQTGGWVGPVPLSSLPEEVGTLFRSGTTGQVYGPVPVGKRFWLVRLEHTIEARLNDATRSLLMNRLYQQWLQAQIKLAISTPGAIALNLESPQAIV